jgi:hypothetical protein
MAKANPENTIEQLIESEVRRRLLNAEPAIHEMLAVSEVLSRLTMESGAVSRNAMDFLTYLLGDKVREVYNSWRAGFPAVENPSQPEHSSEEAA